MNGMFLDPGRPLFTCTAATCEGCPVREQVHCHFGARDLIHFMAYFVPLALIAGVGVAQVSRYLLIPLILLPVAYFGLIEIRVMCSHCPHYTEPGTTSLKCWANYGSPKLWKYRPGPMTTTEKVVFFAGLITVAGYPLAVLLLGGQWLPLGLCAVLLVAAAWFMTTHMCNQCMNFACPLNRVDKRTRALFFATNPGVVEAWKDAG